MVSLEVPETFDELLRVLRGIFAFAVCFGILFWVWYDHYRFFRRYGLDDGFSRVMGARIRRAATASARQLRR